MNGIRAVCCSSVGVLESIHFYLQQYNVPEVQRTDGGSGSRTEVLEELEVNLVFLQERLQSVVLLSLTDKNHRIRTRMET